MAKLLEKVHVASRPPDSLWDVTIEENTIVSIVPSPSPDKTDTEPTAPEARPLLAPALCHPHIHLDKPYLLCSSHSHFNDLIPTTGTFAEALSYTSKAKTRYDIPDLLLRGSQLIVESIQFGVTSMRAFVEVDHVTEFKTLEVAVQLKQKFAGLCYIQIVAFAQDPIWSTEHGKQNRTLLVEALERHAGHIDVLGTTPYVEATDEAIVQNIDWAITIAQTHRLHLDFHLDYNLDEKKKAYVWTVLDLLQKRKWNEKSEKGKTIVLGHCTRLSLFDQEEMDRLADAITHNRLPLSFVGLPTSDIFMMGRPPEGSLTAQRPRGTLQILEMIDRFKINAAIGVNNVGNAFTPWGNTDPLRLASLGVGLYQAGTEKNAKTLLECVSSRAKAAIGILDVENKDVDSMLEVGCKGDLMLIKNRQEDIIIVDGAGGDIRVQARQYRTVRDIVWDPPGTEARVIVQIHNKRL